MSYNKSRKIYSRKNNNSVAVNSYNTANQPIRKQSPGKKYRLGSKNKRRIDTGKVVKNAENRLRNFKQASILAVAITGFIMLVFAPSEQGLGQEADAFNQVKPAGSSAIIEQEPTAVDSLAAPSSREAAEEAISAIQNLWNGFYYNLPKFLIAIATLVLAWLFVRVLTFVLDKIIGNWHSAKAIISIVSISAWLLAIGVAISIVAGDIRALVGSLGLIGLALSWSLQTPIESFTGWLLNSFQGYYRVGDRIQVGEVFGDVYSIDFLTTTVWEIGAPYQSGYVQAEQPTGRMVTFPNNEILTGTVINLTRDFPFVWDELAISIANESDIKRGMQVLESTAISLLGNYMITPAQQYAQMLAEAGLENNVPDRPQVFLSTEDSWTTITIRYLVGARERRKWKSELILRTTEELNKPENQKTIIPVYPRQQVQLINSQGIPIDINRTAAQ
ncbi:mechanosensitive ion channel [Rhodocytophaga aerolata]|uniref:Mechanosensitive ion channel n=1 Tax=Rhodocytophaga aerolata TaxID=455078 RepID=A0ABT8R8B6_9BACT|nr:mechanosensitive ion channel domain-containing protein [Rhodocytophaga aerolata]MDO1448340.1 mechanosensitive ion channel [Rhodocytophaga aerolata]